MAPFRPRNRLAEARMGAPRRGWARRAKDEGGPPAPVQRTHKEGFMGLEVKCKGVDYYKAPDGRIVAMHVKADFDNFAAFPPYLDTEESKTVSYDDWMCATEQSRFLLREVFGHDFGAESPAWRKWHLKHPAVKLGKPKRPAPTFW